MASEIKISNGPSKFDLMVSLFDGNQTPRRYVTFSVDSGKRTPSGPRNSDMPIYENLHAGIMMVAQEDGSGESWIFEGYVLGDNRGRRIHGYYSSKNRSGWYREGAYATR